MAWIFELQALQRESEIEQEMKREFELREQDRLLQEALELQQQETYLRMIEIERDYFLSFGADN